MGKITIVQPSDLTVSTARETVSDERRSLFTEQELASERRNYLPRNGEALQLFETRFGPNATVNTHAHTEDEVIFVTAGEIHLGRRVLATGTALFVEKETLYGFTTGPNGCTFLNFRPAPSASYLSKHEVVGERRDNRPG